MHPLNVSECRLLRLGARCARRLPSPSPASGLTAGCLSDGLLEVRKARYAGNNELNLTAARERYRTDTLLVDCMNENSAP